MNEKWIDVSAHNGVITWPLVAVSGVKGAILRAGYGNDVSQTDRQFQGNMDKAKAVLFNRKGFHFGKSLKTFLIIGARY